MTLEARRHREVLDTGRGTFVRTTVAARMVRKPELLADFYSDDTFYLDPGVPGGVQGKPALLEYFRKLLAQNPDWVWTQIEGIPLEDGFLNKWHASIPVGSIVLDVIGVCFVQLDDSGKIRRNEVFFDRSALLAEMAKART